MTNEKLKLNFPLGGGDVFDSNNEGHLFCYSGAFSNTTNKISDLSFEQLEMHIPMGYKSILICSRIKLFDSGILIKEFKFTSKNEKFILFTNNNYSLYVPNWKREIETTTIYKPNSFDLSLTSSIWENIDECVNYAHEYSKNNNCKVIVSSVLDIKNWH